MPVHGELLNRANSSAPTFDRGVYQLGPAVLNFSFSDLKLTTNGTEILQRKYAEKIGFLVWALPGTSIIQPRLAILL
jgi:hypothetical protein